MRLKSVLLSLSAAAAMHAGVAHANLIVNGNFESTTNGTNKQLSYGTSSASNRTTLTGWTSYNGSDGGYNFVLNAATATTSASVLQLRGTNNGFSGSSDGGNFFASDPLYYPGVLYQYVNGLTVGSTYTVTFEYALAQQTNFSGPNVDDYWQVGLGTSTAGPSQATTALSIADGGFSGWKNATMTFTATGVNQALWFLAKGSSTGAPPFMLLDNVSMNAASTTNPSSAVSEPSSLSMLLGGLGLVGALAYRRRGVARKPA
ncbi:PEP-CTERM sorting domain-containing protein [Massilia forsythiae]|uniref:PEP-CTERM sorting domain-containing protein n=1 Tax=Massilia forsythiae TaxID=2728020 RepID=A0A7Z2ZV95_9BURK|nr:PEP-CTERM sorting domain-containing protein [Massilia forsythiae]QJE01857.1 PEP-CTERM sorting domain-containing protein [Massilia forsythiae]